MAIKNDLINELRNEKFYLDQDFVRLLQTENQPYRTRLQEINEIAVRIAEINQAIGVIEGYLPEQREVPTPQQQESVAEEEGDVITANYSSVEKEHKIQGQSHGE